MEQNVIIKVKDSEDNVNSLFPITKIENIIGMNNYYTKSEVDSAISSSGGIKDEDGNISLNTAGATPNIADDLYIIGAPTQTANPVTYTNSKAYISANGELFSNGKKVVTATADFGATTGSYALSEGLQVRYGQYTGDISNNRFTITFDVPFPNGCLYAQCISSVQDANTFIGPRGIYTVLNKNATSVQFAIPNSAKQPFWIAFGY